VDPHIAANTPAHFLQALVERRKSIVAFWIIHGAVHKHADPPHPLGLLRARRHRPRHRRAAKQRDELAPSQLIEWHSFPASQGHVTGYRIASDQSAGMLEFCNQSWFCLRWRATARYTFGTMNAQIERCSRPRPRHTWQWGS